MTVLTLAMCLEFFEKNDVSDAASLINQRLSQQPTSVLGIMVVLKYVRVVSLLLELGGDPAALVESSSSERSSLIPVSPIVYAMDFPCLPIMEAFLDHIDGPDYARKELAVKTIYERIVQRQPPANSEGRPVLALLKARGFEIDHKRALVYANLDEGEEPIFSDCE